MSHSTHVGFSCPPTAVRRFSPPNRPEFPGPPVFASLAVGVGHRRGVVEFPVRTASVSDTPWCAFEPGRLREPDPFASPAVGVGHMPRSTAFTMTVKDVIALRGPPGIRCFIAKCASGVFPSSCATGVGHKDDSEAEVRGTKGSRR